jgi:biotin carboxylase
MRPWGCSAGPGPMSDPVIRCRRPAGDDPVLVVGTTPDYAAKLAKAYPNSLLFLLDSRFSGNALLESLDDTLLLFAPLEDLPGTRQSLDVFLAGKGVSLNGIACFDCESLMPASELALHLGLPFPAPQPILNARNKFESRRIWAEAGIPSPPAALLSDRGETLAFMRRVKNAIVLKPLSGSGSELLFHCLHERDVQNAVALLERELPRRRSNPLYRPIPGAAGTAPVDPCSLWIAEAFVDGPEFSCDFILDNDRLTIIRETGKIKAPHQTFGSVLAYTVPPLYPDGFSSESLGPLLKRAVSSLGFTRGHFMVDFILRGGRPVIIEMTPRPGGDSIPDLIATATGKDLLGLHLEFAAGRFRPSEGPPVPAGSFASINLYASRNGTLRRIDTSRILSRPWVKAVFLKKNKGDRIILPPASYDDRLIGYCVVSLESCPDPVALSGELHRLLELDFD